MNVIFTDEARRCIVANAKWWGKRRSVQQANRWFDGVNEQILALERGYKLCTHARENGREGFTYPLWDKAVGIGPKGNTHRVVFTIRDEDLLVLTVRGSGQRDLEPEDLPVAPGSAS